VDSDGKWIHANRVAREYTGLTLEEYRSIDVIGRVIHPDDAERMRAVRERALSGSDPFELQARLLGKDGVYRWFLFRTTPWSKSGVPEDGTRAQRKLRRENRRKSRSGKKTCVWRSALELPMNSMTLS